MARFASTANDLKMRSGGTVAAIRPAMTNLDVIDLDQLAHAIGGKKQAHPDWECDRVGGGGGWFVSSEQVPDPENATGFKSKRACESWARKNLNP